MRDESRPLVRLVDPGGRMRARFESSVGPLCSVELTEHGPGMHDDGVLVSHVDCVLVALDPASRADLCALGGIRALGRAHPGATVVVMGDGVDGFDEAFEFGADVWIDRGIDDASLLVALTGRRPVGPPESVGPWWRQLLTRLRRQG